MLSNIDIGHIKREVRDRMGTVSKDIGLKGDGTTNDATLLNSYIASVGSTPTDIYFPSGSYKIGTNVNQPSNVRFIMANGAVFSGVVGTETLTLNGEFDAGLFKTFDNIIVAGVPKLKELYPEWWGAKGDNATDDTIAIQKAIDFIGTKTVNFTASTYLHTGLTMRTYKNIKGNGKFKTFLKNTAVGGNAITFDASSERGKFSDIGIMGNGTSIYGSNATSGHGLVFSNNSVTWVFDNITVRGHGGDGFHGGELGNVNNIYIHDCDVEFNKGDGVNFNAVGGQVNAIYAHDNNVSNNGGSGFSVWGSSININDNTVQGNRKYAYDVNADNCAAGAACNAVNISRNYTEGHLLGVLHAKAIKVVAPSSTTYAINLKFRDNYGSENGLDAGVTAISKLEGVGIAWFDNGFSGFEYTGNESLLSNKTVLLDSNNLLNFTGKIINNNGGYANFINTGSSKIYFKREKYVLNNFLEAKGLTFTDITTGKSPNITTPTSIFYPIQIKPFNGIYSVSLWVDTNYPNAAITFKFYARPATGIAAYTLKKSLGIINAVNGAINTTITGSLETFADFDDAYLEISIAPGAGGTYFYYYNPYIVFNG